MTRPLRICIATSLLVNGVVVEDGEKMSLENFADEDRREQPRTKISVMEEDVEENHAEEQKHEQKLKAKVTVMLTGGELTIPFDCADGYDHWEDNWGEPKRKWCMPLLAGRHGKPFDCSVGAENWVKGWSDEKKTWCCGSGHCQGQNTYTVAWQSVDCTDNADFVDNIGYGCFGWNGFTCTSDDGFVYTEAQLSQVRQNCPRSCGVCGQGDKNEGMPDWARTPERMIAHGGCAFAKFGCCADGKTPRANGHDSCAVCVDFDLSCDNMTQCGRKWARRNCAKTCGTCNMGNWEMIGQGKYCSKETRITLKDNVSVEECKELVLTDTECSREMYSNGQMCRCVKRGAICDFLPSGMVGNSVYKYNPACADATPRRRTNRNCMQFKGPENDYCTIAMASRRRVWGGEAKDTCKGTCGLCRAGIPTTGWVPCGGLKDPEACAKSDQCLWNMGKCSSVCGDSAGRRRSGLSCDLLAKSRYCTFAKTARRRSYGAEVQNHCQGTCGFCDKLPGGILGSCTCTGSPRTGGTCTWSNYHKPWCYVPDISNCGEQTTMGKWSTRPCEGEWDSRPWLGDQQVNGIQYHLNDVVVMRDDVQADWLHGVVRSLMPLHVSVIGGNPTVARGYQYVRLEESIANSGGQHHPPAPFAVSELESSETQDPAELEGDTEEDDEEMQILSAGSQ